MTSRRILILKTLLTSTGRINIIKHSTDKQKRRGAIGDLVAVTILYVILLAYCIGQGAGLSYMGLADLAPASCAFVIALVSFLFSVFKTNGYLFAFKDYDMLMSMPFQVREVVSTKLLYLYVQNIPLIMFISLGILIGTLLFASLNITGIVMWIVLSFVVPLIPMILASLIGTLAAFIGAGFRQKKIVQALAIFILVIPMTFLSEIIQSVSKMENIDELMNSAMMVAEKVMNVLLPVKWFSEAVTEGTISSALLLIGVSLLLFEVFFYLVSLRYREVNTKLMSTTAAHRKVKASYKTKSIEKSIAFKEFKRFTGSTVYLTNAGMGEIFALVFAIAAPIAGGDKLIEFLTSGVSFDPHLIVAVAPILIHIFVGMVPTTVCSPSLEGKNYWIMKSLPISMKSVMNGKALFNLYLSIPFCVVGSVSLALSFGATIGEVVMAIILAIAACFYETYWGLYCGVKFIKLDWDNEIRVIKQGAAVLIYMFPNLVVSVALIVGVYTLGQIIDIKILMGIVAAIMAALAAITYFMTHDYCESEKFKKIN